MLTEAYLDLPDMVKYYGEGRQVEPEDDDLSDRSTISQMPLNFGLIADFNSTEDLTTEKVGKIKFEDRVIWLGGLIISFRLDFKGSNPA